MKCGLRAYEPGATFFGDGVETFGSPSACRGGFAAAGGQESFLFEPVERCVQGSGRGLSASARFNLCLNGDSIGGIIKPQDGQENNLFEFS